MFQIRAEQYATLRRKKIGDALIERFGPTVAEAGWDDHKISVVLMDELGHRSSIGFDGLGFIASYTSPLGRTWRLTNAPNGKLLDLASPSGHSTSLRYNEAGLAGLAGATTFQPVQLYYTALRQFAGSIYADGTQEAIEYTSWNAPARWVDRSGRQTVCSYDEDKRLVALTDGNGNVTQFQYGRGPCPAYTLFPNGTTEFYRYDREGRLSDLVQGDVEVAVKLNAKGRPLWLQYSDGIELEFAYNGAGLVTAARQNDDAITMKYNNRGQLAEEAFGEQKREFAYDPVGRLISLESAGRQVTFSWDEDSRLAGFTDWNGGLHTISYAEADRGLLTTGANGVRSLVSFRSDGKIEEVQVSANGRALYALSCGYEGEARVSAFVDSTFGSKTYSYSPDGELLGVQGSNGSEELFAYDGAGNITSLRGQRAIYDAANQLMATNQDDLRYDSRGNLIARIGVQGAWSFRYNDRNQMVLSVAPSGEQTIYEYDAFGRRTLKRTGPWETRFEWAGEWMIAEEIRNLQTGAVSRQDYLYHPETHEPLATCIDGQVYSYHTDHLGTPRAMTGPDGSVAWLADISAFGQASIAVERVHNPLRLLGQYFDPETGLHYNRFRYYSPEWGRYITRDPLSFKAGPNVYTYVGGDPLNKTDRLGLSFWGAVAGAVAGIAVATLVVLAAPAELTIGAAIGVALLAGALAGAVQEGVNEIADGQHLCWPCIAKAAAVGAALNVLFLGVGVAAEGIAGALERAAARKAEEEAAKQAAKLAAEQAAKEAAEQAAKEAEQAAAKEAAEQATPKSPDIQPKDVEGKSPAEIDAYAKEKGLVPKGPDPQNGKGAYLDPVTGKQRVLSHPNAENPHAHVNDPTGQRLDINGNPVDPESPEAHLGIGGD